MATQFDLPLCLCGCGSLAPIIRFNSYTRGDIKGEYRKYVSGHNVLGTKQTKEHIKKRIKCGPEHHSYGTKASEETRKKQRVAASKRPYTGFPNQRGRKSNLAAEWRTQVFKRDNYTCQKCGKPGPGLNAHHIYPWAKFPHLRYKEYNGMTVCEYPCHRLLHGWKL